MRFRTVIVVEGKTATGLLVPPEVVAALGAGKRPAVTVTVGALTYRSTIAPRGDRYLIPLSGERRAAAGVAGGDEVDVELELDTAPREVDVPSDLAAALATEPAARAFFGSLSFSAQRGFTDGIEGAKKPETRAARVARAVTALQEGRPRP
jgi:hypothetical protein